MLPTPSMGRRSKRVVISPLALPPLRRSPRNDPDKKRARDDSLMDTSNDAEAHNGLNVAGSSNANNVLADRNNHILPFIQPVQTVKPDPIRPCWAAPTKSDHHSNNHDLYRTTLPPEPRQLRPRRTSPANRQPRRQEVVTSTNTTSGYPPSALRSQGQLQEQPSSSTTSRGLEDRSLRPVSEVSYDMNHRRDDACLYR